MTSPLLASGDIFVGDNFEMLVIDVAVLSEKKTHNHSATNILKMSQKSLSPFISDGESTFKIKLKSKVAYLCHGDLCNDDMKDFWEIFLDWIQGQGIRQSNICCSSSNWYEDPSQEHEFIIFISISALGTITVVMFLIFIKFTDAT